MTKIKIFKVASLLLISSLAVLGGCKYDVAEPQWYTQPYIEPTDKPTIVSINPASATPGVNYITVSGANLNLVADTNVFIDDLNGNVVNPEIVQKSATSITFRRPIVTGNCIIKLSPHGGSVVKSSPYSIEPVFERYGSFLDNIELRAITVDDAGNIYIAQVDQLVWKISAAGTKTLMDTAARAVTQSIMGPDGYLYLLSQNREIERVNIETGEISLWHRLGTNRQLRVGDFYGKFLFASGIRTDLWVVNSEDSTSAATGIYGSGRDSVDIVRVHDNHLYLFVRNAAGRNLYKHSIDGNTGTVGAAELVFSASQINGRLPRDIAFTSDGKILITTDGVNPLLVFNPADNSVDTFYKSILPTYFKSIRWGTGNDLYLVSGDNGTATIPAVNWTLYKVRMGMPGD